MEEDASRLTERQRNELAYHRQHAREHEDMVRRPFSFDVLDRPGRRWWNGYWQMYAYLLTQDLRGRRVLVVGCGFGEDALRLARLGAQVTAFDLSPDSLAIARRLAAREGLVIDFGQMPAECLIYADDSFDCIVARDILHHVDIPAAMREIRRVARPQALLVVNEIYSHSLTDTIRRSRFVEAFLYPRMQRLIYGPDSRTSRRTSARCRSTISRWCERSCPGWRCRATSTFSSRAYCPTRRGGWPCSTGCCWWHCGR
ncbi:class I SAM-dependent methyltransferase [Pseudoduganella plicata]|uniref:Class I SAM-dependent methyltransferase n=1 Tax=Pseudoduganella plicata TaxID=321984 RepID=A0A4P7BLH9_9BURK|nr:class I SAM-dependent methyltransferase [Pseudoduganella plicata]QBQ39192.1 class I SAM-dependent methyltransferase [Pseudoduganella plicata]GGY88116.1 hypothetical protein GCM10007388_21930 [Pseudoduganella plicata]